MNLPLSTRLRPEVLDEFVGQTHLVGLNKPLYCAYHAKKLHSMILWGPPGVGKTTLAKLLAKRVDLPIVFLSAVNSGIKEVRDSLEKNTRPIILFIDEIHRFNKAQQDIFLPLIEQGDIIFIGATTENPSFSLNNALLSRTRVYVLKNLLEEDLLTLLDTALTNQERGYGKQKIHFPKELRKKLITLCDGDARRLLNFLELVIDSANSINNEVFITKEALDILFSGTVRRFDKQGDIFHQQISALHKSVRGSDPDAALYWLACLIVGGADPLYIARRMIRAASEDIGNADPRALQLTLNAYDALDRLGSPEGELCLAQAIIYLACAPKSNASYLAWSEAKKDAHTCGSHDVPLHLCNAPTTLMKKLGYGKQYRYPHDEPHGFAASVNYFPENMTKRTYYHPKENQGLEKQIFDKLAALRSTIKIT